MSKFRSLDLVSFTQFLCNKANNHSYLANQDRPMLNNLLKNCSAEPITIAPGETVYIPGSFINKWQLEKPVIADNVLTLSIPVGIAHPIFKNGVKDKAS